MIQIMCKMDSIETEYSEKTLECLMDIMGDDDEFDNDEPNYETMWLKDGKLFDGEEVQFGLWTCKLVETIKGEQITWKTK